MTHKTRLTRIILSNLFVLASCALLVAMVVLFATDVGYVFQTWNDARLWQQYSMIGNIALVLIIIPPYWIWMVGVAHKLEHWIAGSK